MDPGHHQNMSRKQRPMIEKRRDIGFVEDDVGLLGAAENGTEDAIGHAGTIPVTLSADTAGSSGAGPGTSYTRGAA